MTARNIQEERIVARLTRQQERERDTIEVHRRRAASARIEPLARALVDGFIAQVEDPEPHLRAVAQAVHAATVRAVGPEDAAALFGVLARVGERQIAILSPRQRGEREWPGRAVE